MTDIRENILREWHTEWTAQLTMFINEFKDANLLEQATGAGLFIARMMINYHKTIKEVSLPRHDTLN